ncbi:SulA-like leucine-rich domain-containing protein [Enterovibrio calviensis]|uniref:SulA-like leucine-rich domain-containing protein n=1 Tax=Enterovibrio calviensis TaxID=91359 RepID=UPI000487016A|nr:SulA-like leucine-rich domain-containing protein [Enterovibrio calviensis]
MKHSYATPHSVPHQSMSRPVVREHYARLAAGAKSYRHTDSNAFSQEGNTNGRLVSVNVYQNNMSELAYLLRVLKSFSESQKWITLIAPPSRFCLSLFQQAGIQASQIRIARPTSTHDAIALMKKAMASDTSSAVIAFGEYEEFHNAVLPQHCIDSGEPNTEAQGFVINGFSEHLH